MMKWSLITFGIFVLFIFGVIFTVLKAINALMAALSLNSKSLIILAEREGNLKQVKFFRFAGSFCNEALTWQYN